VRALLPALVVLRTAVLLTIIMRTTEPQRRASPDAPALMASRRVG
jgi:hypothetical protein